MSQNAFIFSFLFLLLVSCGSEPGKESYVLAKVGEKQLLKSDLAGIIPSGLKPNDSLEFVKNYATVWVKEQVLLNKAEENLGEDLKDFEKQLQDYRKSLLIFTFENELAKNMNDTNVTENEIEAYYEKEKENFRLRDNIFRLNYIITSTNNKELNKVKKLMGSENEKDKEILNSFCVNSAYKCFLEDSVWLSETEMARDIPIENGLNLRAKSLIEIKDSSLNYVLYIKQISKTGETSPLEFVRDNVKSIILNNRKKNYIQKMREKIYKEAEQNKTFEIYIQ